MNTAVINVKVDSRVKAKAREIAGELGLSLSAYINASLRELVRSKAINFSLVEEPSDYLIESIKKSEEDIKAGRVISFKGLKQATKHLDKMITDEKKSSKN